VKVLVKNGRVIDPVSGIDETLDILIDKGKIAELKPQIKAEDVKTVDAARLVVAPGFIDMHVHLREPGQEHKETIRTGSRAAARGGFTTICCMPNTVPPNDNRGVTEYILSEARKSAVVNVLPIAAISKGLKGEELADLADLAAAGAVGFSDDGKPVANSLLMRRALEYTLPLKPLVIDHCEERSLSEDGHMHEGFCSHRFGIRGMPAAAEEIMVARDIILAEQAGARIHIAHLSVKGAARLVREAKARKVRVTAEVTPHHLVLTDAALESYDTNFKMNPPLRSEEDVEALLEAVKDGTVDVIATDHAPHAAEDKDQEFDLASFGITGLETAVSVLLDRLVHKKIISLARLIELCASNPARILGLEGKGRITPGADADLVLLALGKEIVVEAGEFQSLGRNSPFIGWKLKGTPVMTIVGGRIIYPFA
jgi:dihydroorotase